MNYVISRYVYLFISSKGDCLAYCTKTNAFCKIGNELYSLLLECRNNSSLIANIDKVSLEVLMRNKIVVESGEDENYILKRQYETNMNSFASNNLVLTIVPTLECNFACPYCFEKAKRQAKMSDGTIDALIEFIKSHIGNKTLGICWYGGEPLLAFDVMKKIMKRIKEELNISIKKHIIITNGSLINREILNFFSEYSLDSIQITLDGNKERHDSIRKNKFTEEPTYDLLINNINQILKELPSVRVDVRINIDKDNQEDFHQALDWFGKKNTNENLNVYPGFLRVDDETGKALACNSFHKSDIANFMLNLSKSDVRKQFYPTLVKTVCMAVRTNAYIVGPVGEIYKCWNDVSDVTKVVGSIFKKELSNPALYYKYIAGSKWYNRENCKKCFFLPICDNGCAWYLLKNQDENAHFELCNCMQKSPGMLSRCLENYYEQKLLKQNLF